MAPGDDRELTEDAVDPELQELDDATINATVAERPAALREKSSAGSQPAVGSQPAALGSHPSTHATAGPRGLRALHVEEVQRARGMALLLGGLCAVCVASFPLLGGERTATIVGVATSAYFTLVCGYVWLRAQPDEHYARLFRLFSGSAVMVSGAIVYFIGVFSPAPIAVTLGISFFGTGRDARWSVACCIVASIIYSTLAALIAVGVMPDVGLIRGPDSAPVLLFACVMVPIVFVGTLRQALISRRGAYAAMAQVEDAARAVQQREAQLVEANRDLDRALQAGAGKVGRHSGRHAGRWILGDVIGRGAMGEVYAATHESGQSVAAVKTLVSGDPDQLLRFRREAEIAAKVRSPGLVTLYEAGVLDDAVPFLVMELLTGHDLAWHLRKSRQLEIDEAVVLVEQVAAGLHDAHVAGIVHRDIKPQNLFRHEPPSGGPASWKVLDFGVSKLSDSSGTLTQNMVVGTPGYMAPEQARGQTADARSDLFALGAVVYRSLTAQPAFKGNDTPAIMFDVVYRAPRRPSELRPALPEDVDRFLAIALAKKASDRFTSAGAFADALRAATKGGLSTELRLQADLLLAGLPWGGRVKD